MRIPTVRDSIRCTLPCRTFFHTRTLLNYSSNYTFSRRLGNLHTKYNLSSVSKNSTCEVLLQVKASSVNPSDINPTTAFEHTVLGSDVAGVVLDVGEDCERLKRGDTVFGDIGANTVARFSQKKTKELT